VVGVLAFLIGITVLVWTATGTAGLLAHGGWPDGLHFTHTPQAMRQLIGDPHDIPAAWPTAHPSGLPGSGLFWGIFVGQLMILFVLAVFAIGVTTRYRLVRARRRAGYYAKPAPTDPAPARDNARPEPDPDWSVRPPATVPPTVPAPAPAPVPPSPAPPAAPAANAAPQLPAGLPGDGELDRTWAVFTALPPTAYGPRLTHPAIRAAAGPVLVVTADPGTFHQTAGARAKLGPVHLFDPSHLTDSPDRLRWAPHSGCADPATAANRATALLFPVRPRATLDTAVHDTALRVLRCWLHAAAVDGRPFRQVHRWASGGNAQEPVRVLRTHPRAASGWSGELESMLHGHPDRRDAARALIHRALESLASVHIRDACSPSGSGTFDGESWLRERGSLYVVGEAAEDSRVRPGVLPLLTALADSVVEHGRRAATGSPGGRLDPPVTVVLDGAATVAPLPGLPELLAGGTPLGLPTLALFRSPEQARSHWPAPVWRRADARLLLGPAGPGLAAEIPDATVLG
jgi:hypothetical protein